MTLAELPAHWRERAKDLRRFAPSAAAAFESAADELQQSLQLNEAELLTLAQASRESGYSADHLSVLVKEGKIENLGRKHAPRVRRRDLPRKPDASSKRPALVTRTAGGATLSRIQREALHGRSRR